MLRGVWHIISNAIAVDSPFERKRAAETDRFHLHAKLFFFPFKVLWQRVLLAISHLLWLIYRLTFNISSDKLLLFISKLACFFWTRYMFLVIKSNSLEVKLLFNLRWTFLEVLSTRFFDFVCALTCLLDYFHRFRTMYCCYVILFGSFLGGNNMFSCFYECGESLSVKAI